MSDLQPIQESKAVTTTASVASGNVTGRMIANFRNHHIVVDAPDYANGLGQAPVPPELFLTAVGACAIGMFELVSARDGIPLKKCSVDLESTFGSQTRNAEGVTIFDNFTLKFIFEGVSRDQAQELIDTFHANCPLYGSVKMSADNVNIEFDVVA